MSEQNDELDLELEHEPMDEQHSAVEHELVEHQEEEKRGYVGYDDWVERGGDPDEFQGAKAYDNYGKLLKEVKKLQKEVRSKSTTLETMADLYRQQEDKIAEKYKNYYQQQQHRLNEAEQIGDTAGVKDAMKAIHQTEQAYQNDLNSYKAQYQQQLVEEFKMKNDDWYNSQHPELVAKAQELALRYEREYPHLAQTDPIYLLQKVESEIRDRYLTANTYAAKNKTVGGANYTLPPSQSAGNKAGVGAKNKLTSLPTDMRDEYKKVKAEMAEIGMEYTIDDYLNFHERNKV